MGKKLEKKEPYIRGVTNVTNVTSNSNNYNKNNISNILRAGRNFLSPKDIIVFFLFENEANISEISKQTGLDAQSVQKHLSHSGRSSGLIDKDLVKISKYEGNVKYFVTSEKGKNRVLLLLQDYEREQELLRLAEMRASDSVEQIAFFEDYFKLHPELYNNMGQKRVVIDFNDLSMTNPEIAEKVLEDPLNIQQVAIHAFNNLDSGLKEVSIRFSNLPNTTYVPVSGIRSEHLNKFIKTKGKIINFTKVLPKITSTRFECPSCGNIIPILQLDEKFKEPSMCSSCGRKGNFRVIKNTMLDAQKIVLEESVNDLGRRSRMGELNIVLTGDLTNLEIQHYFEGAEEITINGIVQDAEITLRTGGRSVRRDLFLDANMLEIELDEEDEITTEVKKKILEESKKPEFKKRLSESFAPHIIGWEKEKLGLLLCVVSGGQPRGQNRDDSHCMCVGDPSTAKSELLRSIKNIFPMVRETSGETSSGAGLTAAFDKKDDFFGGSLIRKGALPLAHGGGIVIDEIDKFPTDQLKYLHSALEQQEFPFNKGGLHQKFLTDCFCICAANPKGSGRFDRNTEFSRQIKFPPTILSRMDLVFVFLDEPDMVKDREVASKILSQEIQNNNSAIFSEEFLKALVVLARRTEATLTKETIPNIKEAWVRMRTAVDNNDWPVTHRTLQAIMRLSKAHAKIHLRSTVEKKDVDAAVDMINYSFERLRVLKIDTSTMEIGVSSGFSKKADAFKKAHLELQKEFGKVIPLDELQKKVGFELDEDFLFLGRDRKMWSEPRVGHIKLEGDVL